MQIPTCGCRGWMLSCPPCPFCRGWMLSCPRCPFWCPPRVRLGPSAVSYLYPWCSQPGLTRQSTLKICRQYDPILTNTNNSRLLHFAAWHIIHSTVDRGLVPVPSMLCHGNISQEVFWRSLPDSLCWRNTSTMCQFCQVPWNSYNILSLLVSHISKIHSKARCLIGMLYRRFYKHAKSNILLKLCVSLVRPHLGYCSVVWDPYLNKDTNLLEKHKNLDWDFVSKNGRLIIVTSCPEQIYPALNQEEPEHECATYTKSQVHW